MMCFSTCRKSSYLQMRILFSRRTVSPTQEKNCEGYHRTDRSSDIHTCQHSSHNAVDRCMPGGSKDHEDTGS